MSGPNQPRPSVFEVAYNVVENIDDVVSSRIEQATRTSNELSQSALSAITALERTNLEFSAGALPVVPRLDLEIPVDLNLPPITASAFGSITSQMPGEPVLADVPDIEPREIPAFEPPIVIAILTALFIIQQFGTSLVGKAFGPIMFVWFTMMAVLGSIFILQYPAILQSVNPYYAYKLLVTAPNSFLILAISPAFCFST